MTTGSGRRGRDLRLVLTARDPGAAEQIGAIALQARRSGFATTVVASGPALGILEAAGLHPISFADGPVQYGDEVGFAPLRGNARELLDMLVPDALVIGLSHFDELGVDEAMAYACPDIPIFAMQDFWGDVDRFVIDRRAHLLVLDAEAKRLSKARYDGPTTVVGSPKHEGVVSRDAAAIRAAKRERLGVDATRTVVGYFGQALASIPGYLRQVELLSRTLAATFPDAVLLYRPHPRQDRESVSLALAAFVRGGTSPMLCLDREVYPALAASDLILSCISTCGLDALFLTRDDPLPMPAIGYLLTEPDLSDFASAVIPEGRLPLVTMGLAFEVRDPTKLSTALRAALDMRWREATRTLARERLPDARGSADRVLALVAEAGTNASRQRTLRTVPGR
jgi:hypothetical protein